MAEKRNIQMCVNGELVTVFCDPTARLVDVLRNELRLTGTKEGCAVGECGACTVLVDGQICASCLTMVGQVEGKDILTVEGLSKLMLGRRLQECFVEEGAVQCGFCTPGMLISAYGLLLHNPQPSRAEIRLAMSGNLCRCTGYVPILNAIEKAALPPGRPLENTHARVDVYQI